MMLLGAAVAAALLDDGEIGFADTTDDDDSAFSAEPSRTPDDVDDDAPTTVVP
jgi:hypothetical protein